MVTIAPSSPATRPEEASLVGMTRQELQDAMGLYFDDAAKIITFLPDDIRLNTIRAFNTDVLTSTGYSTSRGVPTG